jgi:hypothetical protein
MKTTGGKTLAVLVPLLFASQAGAQFYWPISGQISRGPGTQGHDYNAADIAGPNGGRVGTSNEGWYHAKLSDPEGYGNYAMVRHRNACGGTDFYTLYAHLSGYTGYGTGTWMTRSQPDGTEADGMMTVGYEGSTGRSTGPHVHFEIRHGSTKLWFVAPKYSNVNKNTGISGSDFECAVQNGSDPTASTWGPGRLDVFVRGGDKALWHKWYDSGTWSGWQSLGGILTSAPDAVSWGTGRIDIFALDTHHGVVQKSYVSGTGWSSWVSQGAPPGGASSDPSVVSWGPGRLDVFVRGNDYALWHKLYDNGTWSGWESLGGILSTAPDASTWGAGRIDIFALDTDSNVVQKSYLGAGQWSAWVQRGGSATSAPGAVSWTQGRIDVFARGSDNSLIHQYWNGTQWSPWISEGGILNSGADVTSWGDGRLDVVSRNTNNDIVHKWFVRGTGWSAWGSLGTP